MQNIVIIDYGMGNIHSVKKQFERLNVQVIVSAKAEEIINADKIILPGVGHFGKAIEHLTQLNLIEVLNEAVLVQKKPILGICLGMQLMAQSSEEGNINGLGWIDATIEKFKVYDTLNFKVPHIGWNSAKPSNQSPLFAGIEENDLFYFVHTFHAKMDKKEQTLTTTNYCYEFASSFGKENIFGVQFHPEKSHDAGMKLLKNFIEI